MGWVGFSVPVSHRITAGADMLAMPSRFEPCGLNQMYAMRYGTIPVAHATGGLKDTVRRDVGFPFSPCEPDTLAAAVDHAFKCYWESNGRECADSGGEGVWERKQVRAMTRDLSWARAAKKYEKVFRGVALPPPPVVPLEGVELPGSGRGGAMGHLAAAAAAAVQDDKEARWARCAKRAEMVRRRAERCPDTDTRTKGTSDPRPSWYKTVPRKLLLALLN